MLVGNARKRIEPATRSTSKHYALHIASTQELDFVSSPKVAFVSKHDASTVLRSGLLRFSILLPGVGLSRRAGHIRITPIRRLGSEPFIAIPILRASFRDELFNFRRIPNKPIHTLWRRLATSPR